MAGMTREAMADRWVPVAVEYVEAACTLAHDKRYQSVLPKQSRVQLEAVYGHGLLFRALTGVREFVTWGDLLAGHIRVQDGALGVALAMAGTAPLTAAVGWA